MGPDPSDLSHWVVPLTSVRLLPYIWPTETMGHIYMELGLEFWFCLEKHSEVQICTQMSWLSKIGLEILRKKFSNKIFDVSVPDWRFCENSLNHSIWFISVAIRLKTRRVKLYEHFRTSDKVHFLSGSKNSRAGHNVSNGKLFWQDAYFHENFHF